MANIIVVADIDAGDASGFVLKERVSAPLLDDAHFSSQLIERIGWALADAEQAERARDGRTQEAATASTEGLRTAAAAPTATDERGVLMASVLAGARTRGDATVAAGRSRRDGGRDPLRLSRRA